MHLGEMGGGEDQAWLNSVIPNGVIQLKKIQLLSQRLDSKWRLTCLPSKALGLNSGAFLRRSATAREMLEVDTKHPVQCRPTPLQCSDLVPKSKNTSFFYRVLATLGLRRQTPSAMQTPPMQCIDPPPLQCLEPSALTRPPLNDCGRFATKPLNLTSRA